MGDAFDRAKQRSFNADEVKLIGQAQGMVYRFLDVLRDQVRQCEEAGDDDGAEAARIEMRSIEAQLKAREGADS